ncbi:MAG: tyrosine-type recombinase/integrase [Acidimicrobiales bacterium]
MPATAEALAFFVASRADEGLKPGSVRAQLHHIVARHHEAGHPTLGLASLAEEILDAYSRTNTGGPRKAPVLPISDLAEMASVAAWLGPFGLQDRVILCAGYCGAMRIDDLARARLEDVEATPWGAVLRLRASKDNPTGKTAETVVLLRRNDALDPIAAIDDLIAATGSASGPLVPVEVGSDRSLRPDSFAYRLEAMAQQAGLRVPPTGHSLRRSWATHAYEAGVDLVTIQRHLRHASPTTTKGYIESLSPWVENAAVRMAQPNLTPGEPAEANRETSR